MSCNKEINELINEDKVLKEMFEELLKEYKRDDMTEEELENFKEERKYYLKMLDEFIKLPKYESEHKEN